MFFNSLFSFRLPGGLKATEAIFLEGIKKNEEELRAPGMAMGIAGVVLTICVFACVRCWPQVLFLTQRVDDEDAKNSRAEQEINMGKWRECIDKGELDLYTCLSLSLGRHKTLKAAVRYIPRLAVLACMQVFLGFMLLTYQVKLHHYVPATQGYLYRSIGSVLFAYAAWMLFSSMFDDCRTDIVRVMLVRGVSGWYAWPIIFGEYVSTSVTCLLMGILYLIFCDCTRPQEFLINFVAIKFLAEVDNEVVTEEDSLHAIRNLRAFNAEWRQSDSSLDSRPRASSASSESGAEPSSPDTEQSALYKRQWPLEQKPVSVIVIGFIYANKIIRFLVPPFGGILVFLFEFSNDEALCRNMHMVQPWPFCLRQE